MLALLEELRSKSAADAAQKCGLRKRVWPNIGLTVFVHIPPRTDDCETHKWKV